jgi:hypothetical protein
MKPLIKKIKPQKAKNIFQKVYPFLQPQSIKPFLLYPSSTNAGREPEPVENLHT